MTATAQTIATALRDSPVAELLTRLATMRALLAAIQPTVARMSPGTDLTAASAAELQDTTLILSVDSAAQAAKLRQAKPSLLHTLAQQGYQVSEIRFRIQPEPDHRLTSNTKATETTARLTPDLARAELQQALAAAETLARTVTPSPLREAARGLAASVARRLAQTTDPARHDPD